MQKRRAFRPLQPEQITLLPPSPREWLSEVHQVYFLLDLVDEQGVCRPQHPAVSAPLGQLSWSAGGLLLERRRGGVMRREGESGPSVHLPVAAISTCCCDRVNRHHDRFVLGVDPRALLDSELAGHAGFGIGISGYRAAFRWWRLAVWQQAGGVALGGR